MDVLSLSSSRLPSYTELIFLVEIEVPLFEDINAVEWHNLQRLLQYATRIVWITNGGLLSGREPLFAMITGIVRGLKTEKNSLRMSTLDLDPETGGSLLESCSTIFTLLDRFSQDPADNYTLDYRQRDHTIYQSSLQPDDELNTYWQTRASERALTRVLPLEDFQDMPLQLNAEQEGAYSSIFFEPDQDFDQVLPDGCLEIELGAASVNGTVSELSSLHGHAH